MANKKPDIVKSVVVNPTVTKGGVMSPSPSAAYIPIHKPAPPVPAPSSEPASSSQSSKE